MTEPTENNFKTNFAELKSISEILRTQQEPDIDALIPMVEKGAKCYKFCKERIAAVNLAFAEQMPEVVSQ